MPDQKAMGFEDGLRRIDEQIADVRHMVHLWLEERTAIPRNPSDNSERTVRN
jgi:hypothetical protein